eukprot:TRINITY_DN93428_c0_g1_i1.p1 TRINITY_DN93428_c0_g1~~TRINITY_DN93428_c0_g1_i1.p1  ORF type:complete len:437 (+),score=101.87 TRINITY_DN93428_c0_g1_i1:73-1383(+)
MNAYKKHKDCKWQNEGTTSGGKKGKTDPSKTERIAVIVPEDCETEDARRKFKTEVLNYFKKSSQILDSYFEEANLILELDSTDSVDMVMECQEIEPHAIGEKKKKQTVQVERWFAPKPGSGKAEPEKPKKDTKRKEAPSGAGATSTLKDWRNVIPKVEVVPSFEAPAAEAGLDRPEVPKPVTADNLGLAAMAVAAANHAKKMQTQGPDVGSILQKYREQRAAQDAVAAVASKPAEETSQSPVIDSVPNVGAMNSEPNLLGFSMPQNMMMGGPGLSGLGEIPLPVVPMMPPPRTAFGHLFGCLCIKCKQAEQNAELAVKKPYKGLHQHLPGCLCAKCQAGNPPGGGQPRAVVKASPPARANGPSFKASGPPAAPVVTTIKAHLPGCLCASCRAGGLTPPPPKAVAAPAAIPKVPPAGPMGHLPGCICPACKASPGMF